MHGVWHVCEQDFIWCKEVSKEGRLGKSVWCNMR